MAPTRAAQASTPSAEFAAGKRVRVRDSRTTRHPRAAHGPERARRSATGIGNERSSRRATRPSNYRSRIHAASVASPSQPDQTRPRLHACPIHEREHGNQAERRSTDTPGRWLATAFTSLTSVLAQMNDGPDAATACGPPIDVDRLVAPPLTEPGSTSPSCRVPRGRGAPSARP